MRVDAPAVPAYAERLAREEDLASAAAGPQQRPASPDDREDAAARVLILDAINFGSGWFPTLNKRPGLSGYRTIAQGLSERFEQHGPWTADELRTIEPQELARTLQQTPDHPLIPLFIASLRDLGTHVDGLRGFTKAIGETALATVDTLAAWECFQDTSRYDELELPFLKRAQIAAADLHRAGVVDYTQSLKDLTIFADNLVPHVLALDGVLELDPKLQQRIANEELIEHDSPQEVELRACAVHAAELLVAELAQQGHDVTAAQVDAVLWERGGRPLYKASPRPRSRTTAY